MIKSVNFFTPSTLCPRHRARLIEFIFNRLWAKKKKKKAPTTTTSTNNNNPAFKDERWRSHEESSDRSMGETRHRRLGFTNAFCPKISRLKSLFFPLKIRHEREMPEERLPVDSSACPYIFSPFLPVGIPLCSHSSSTLPLFPTLAITL